MFVSMDWGHTGKAIQGHVIAHMVERLPRRAAVVRYLSMAGLQRAWVMELLASRAGWAAVIRPAVEMYL